jgi:UDP-N-acetylglucosamine--N-acetylmuramyl-(pentapeptide) pyrophosphoryl-undecaprenol N-acetylglucosamine transferase
MTDLVFFTSPIGLGHATRTVAISQYLDNTPKKFISGIGAYKLLSEYGFNTVDLYRPPPFRIENGKLHSQIRWLFDYLAYYKECKKISTRIMEKEMPKLVVSDEDFASLVIAQKQKTKTVLITDILETKFTKGIGAIIEKKMNQVMKGIIEKCDLVIVPENGQDYDNIVRVGPIVRNTTESREQLRKKYSFNRKTIVVSIGGTDLGKFLIEKTVEAFEKSNCDAELVIVSGPTLQMKQLAHRNLGFARNLHEIIYAADLVISLAGKSTMDESKHYGTPGIFIPIKGHFEQEENAREIGYSYEDIFRLEELILEKINEKRNPQYFQGGKTAAELIRKFF